MTDDITVENFDLGEWLTGATYHGKSVEIFRDGDRLGEMAELLELVERQTAALAEQARQLTSQPKDITESGPQAIIDEAQAQADEILDSLRGTGLTFRLRGVSPGERKILEDKVSRSLKPSPAKYEVIDGQKVEIEPATRGGSNHPDWNLHFTHLLLSKSIIEVSIGADTWPIPST